MTNTRITWAALATAGLLALTGCGGPSNATPAPTPAPTTSSPSVSTTPAPGSATPTAMTSAQLQAEAEAVYRRQNATFVGLVKKGGLAMSEPTPPALSADVAGAALTKRLNELHQVKLKGFKYVSGDGKVAWVKPSTKSQAGAKVALTACEDFTEFTNMVDGKKVHGLTMRVDSYYAEVDGRLKMINSVNEKVASCAA